MRRSGQPSVFTERLGEIIEARLRGDEEHARLELEAIVEVGAVRVTRSVPRRREAAVLARDRYTCRYCGLRMVSIPVLRAVHELFPTVFRWHLNWKSSDCDVAFWRDATSLDHRRPVTRGGGNDAGNLVTACWPCNASKGNLTLEELGIEILDPPETSWDGLSAHLPDLVALLPVDHRFSTYFKSWKAAILNPEPL
jgi:5-methylcytosine-specific restriction endonuclease McrA